MSAVDELDPAVQILLAPLERLAPVLRGDAVSARTTAQRGIRLVAATVVLLALAYGVAFADGSNPFTGIAAFVGISAADHPQTAHDVLDPQTAKLVKQMNTNFENAPGRRSIRSFQLEPDTARLVGELPGFGKLYVLQDSRGDLCLMTGAGGGCSRPLSNDQPTTLSSFDRVKNGPGATPPITWGITEDGVTSVSFRAHGVQHTVPVVHNVWFYIGQSNATRSLTLHYANGNEKVIRH